MSPEERPRRVLPQLVTDLDEARLFESVTAEAGSTYVEIALVLPRTELLARYEARTASPDDEVQRAIDRIVECEGGPRLVSKIDADFAAYLANRPDALVVDASGTSRAAVLRLIRNALEAVRDREIVDE